jgi:hypothetical protein
MKGDRASVIAEEFQARSRHHYCVVMAVRALLGGTALTVRASVAAPVPFALVAPIVTLVVPETVGVPLITPVDVLTERPAGSGEALKLAGEFVAVMVKEKLEPIVPGAVRALVLCRGDRL